jgi:copper chaperone CopZ
MIRSLLLSAGVLLFVGCSGEKLETNSVTTDEVTSASFNSEKSPIVEFNVPDMMCPEGCGAAVKEILSKQPGAKDVLVNFEGKSAKVAIEPSKFDADKALAALVDRQFTNSSLKDSAIAKMPESGKEPIQ